MEKMGTLKKNGDQKKSPNGDQCGSSVEVLNFEEENDCWVYPGAGFNMSLIAISCRADFCCCCSICSYVTYLRNNLEIIYYTANSCQPSWLSHVQLSLQLVQPRWGVGDGLFQLE